MNEAPFKAFDDFGIADIPRRAEISRRMLRRLEAIDDPKTNGPVTPAARAALASSVIAHAVVEVEVQLLELRARLEAN
jgi:hypothetical protein